VALVVRDVAAHLEALKPALPDLLASGFIERIELVEADAFGAEVTLAAPQA
jgi:hypothetical protein